jgi:DNA-binding NtrC family response regulator
MTANPWKLLIVDDEESIRKTLKSRLEREGHSVIVAASAEEAESMLARERNISVVITDVRMPGKDGVSLLSEQKPLHPEKKFIIMTGHGEKSTAVTSLKNGASDYLEKPFEMDEILHSVKRAQYEFDLERRAEEQVINLKERAKRAESLHVQETWVAPTSLAMKPVLDWLSVLKRESMKNDAPEPSVFISGESGTGKEGIAQLIHRQSRRGNGAWVVVNCANFTAEQLDSELFGHEKGAFSGAMSQKRGLVELADHGTIFLEEVAHIDSRTQGKVVQLLKDGTFRRMGGTDDIQVDVRVISATHSNLEEATQNGSFRGDLLQLLTGVHIQLPTLKLRREDIVLLAKNFAANAFRARGKNFLGFTQDAESALENYDWPGNVRELQNVMDRTALCFEGSTTVDAYQIMGLRVRNAVPLRAVSSSELSVGFEVGAEGFTSLKKRFSDEFERQFILRSLERHNGNVSAASKEALIDRSNFLRLMRRHTIRSAQYRKAA